MPGLWARLKRLLALRRRGRRPRDPLKILEEHKQKLFESMDRLSWQALKLGEVRRQLQGRARSLERLVQRYEEQARKQYKLGQVDLAKAALREKLRYQEELKRLRETVEALGRQQDELKAHKERLVGQLELYRLKAEALELRYRATQAELEARELQLGLSSDEMPDLQEAVSGAEEEIRRIQAQLEALEELHEDVRADQGGLAVAAVSREVEEAHLREEIERLRRELLPKRNARAGKEGKGKGEGKEEEEVSPR